MRPETPTITIRPRSRHAKRPLSITREVTTHRGHQRTLASLLVGMVVVGLAWRLARLLAGFPIWYDEAFLALSWMTRDWEGLLGPLKYYQVAPIGFLAVERGMTEAFGPSAIALRLVPFLAGSASLILFARFALRAVGRTRALLAVAIFAASYYPARHSAEVKPYAIDLLLALMTVELAWLSRTRPGLRSWLALTALVSVGVWFSYPLVFVAAGVGSTLAIRALRARDSVAVAALSSMGLIWAASWLAMYLLVGRPQAAATAFYATSTTWEAAFPPYDRPWSIPLWLLDVHTGNMLAYPNGGNRFGSTGTTILVLLGAWSLRRRRPMLVALLLSPLAPTLLASAFHRYPYGTSARTMLFMAPSFCLLAGVGVAGLLRRVASSPRRERIGVLVTALGLGLGVVISTIGNLAAPWREVADVENRRVAQELAALAGPGDLWVGFDGIEALPPGNPDLMSHRWVGQAAEIHYNLLAHARVPVRWMPGPGTDLATPGRIWLIVHRSGFPQFSEAPLLALRSRLDRDLGPPIVHDWSLTPVISIRAYEYPPVSPGPPSPRGRR